MSDAAKVAADELLPEWPVVEYEVWQKDAFGDGDAVVACSTSLADAQHYAAVYGQDGPAWVVEATRRRFDGARAPDTELLAALEEARLQIEYLHGKFQETGSGNAVLAKIGAAITKARGQ